MILFSQGLKQRKLGFAVVGVGNFGLKRINALKTSTRARAASIFDPNTAKAEKVASDVGAKVQSFDQILDDPEVDVVDIATPNKYHAEYALKTLQAGKVAWCEKPLASTVEQCRAILQAARKHSGKVKVGSTVRFFPNILKLKELSNSIGTPLFFRGYIGNVGRQLKGSSWYAKRELVGGGALLDLGVHLIDLIRWLLGEIESCYATTSSNVWHLSDLEDLAMCTFQLSSGARASIQASWHEWCGYMYFEIYGTQGFIRSDNRFSTARLTIGNKEKVLNEYDYSSLGQISYANELEHFTDSYFKSRELEPSAYDGYRAVKIVRACYESALSKKAICCIE